MIITVTITVVLLAAGALCALVRVIRGPSILDRMVAVDALLVAVIAGLAAEAAYNRNPTTLPLLVVLALLGFTASTAVAQFVGGRDAPRDGVAETKRRDAAEVEAERYDGSGEVKR